MDPLTTMPADTGVENMLAELLRLGLAMRAAQRRCREARRGESRSNTADNLRAVRGAEERFDAALRAGVVEVFGPAPKGGVK